MLQSVEVTGSRLRASEAEGTSPVQVVTAAEIQRMGVSSLRELFVLLASNTSGPIDLGGSGSFAAGSSATSMRSLGVQATLVLLNFRRVAPYPLANYAEVFTNIDALPFEAIDRVEVLKSGASALYGSDAVAGVINIITKRDWTGLQARASHERSLTSGRLRASTASVTAGFGAPGTDAGHLMLNLEVYRRDNLMWNDALQYVDTTLTSRSAGFGTTSTYSWPGNIIGVGPVAGCDPALVQGGLCRYDRYARFEAIPSADRVNLLASGDLPLRSGRLFGELLVADTRNTYLKPFQPYGSGLSPVTWGDPLTNGTRTFVYRRLPVGHPLNPSSSAEAELRYRFVDGPNQDMPHTLQYRSLVGWAGNWRGFDAESATGVMGGHTQLAQRGAFSARGFTQVIGSSDPGQSDPQFFNRAYRIGKPNPPEVIDALFPTYGYTGRVRHWFMDGKLTGTAAQLPHGPLNLAIGGEVRREQHSIQPSANLLAGDIVGNGLSASDAARWVGSVFAEASGRVTPSLELQAAARVDQYPSLAPHLSPKLALRWQLAPAWMLRAMAEAGFRAPNLTESAESTKFSYESVSDPRRCPQAQALAADLRGVAAALPATDPQGSLLQARADNLITVECQGAISSIVRNNPSLRPESSRSMNAGVVFAPGPRWSLTLDVWDIQRRDEIGLRQ
jgi:iron complex outermembrane receptor protein